MESPEYQLEIVLEEAVSPELDVAIRALLCECFPPDVPLFRQCRWWHGCMPEYSLVCRQDQYVLGHVGIVRRTITCGGKPVDVAGIQSLAVSSALRGSGLSRQLMGRSMVEAKRRGILFGLLFCLPTLERLYASLGWERRNTTVTMLDEAGLDVPLPGKNIMMVLNLTSEAFPQGDIHLQGRDW
jgi:predicted N-acetyltransferase YhbS